MNFGIKTVIGSWTLIFLVFLFFPQDITNWDELMLEIKNNVLVSMWNMIQKDAIRLKIPNHFMLYRDLRCWFFIQRSRSSFSRASFMYIIYSRIIWPLRVLGKYFQLYIVKNSIASKINTTQDYFELCIDWTSENHAWITGLYIGGELFLLPCWVSNQIK